MSDGSSLTHKRTASRFLSTQPTASLERTRMQLDRLKKFFEWDSWCQGEKPRPSNSIAAERQPLKRGTSSVSYQHMMKCLGVIFDRCLSSADHKKNVAGCSKKLMCPVAGPQWGGGVERWSPDGQSSSALLRHRPLLHRVRKRLDEPEESAGCHPF